MPNSPHFPLSLHDQLHARRRRVPVTLLLIAANVVVFLLTLNAGAGLWHSNAGVQLAWGANFGPATQDGQWWRLGSALFLHFGLFHIAMNLWALWDAGQLVERMYGHGRFIAIYLGSGLAGNLLSLVTQGNQAISGGASGAIFGIYGALLIFLWLERSSLEPQEFRWLFRAASAFTGISITLGLLVPGIDNSAHIGGLIAGLLLGMLLGRPLRDAAPWSWQGRCAGGLLLAVTVGGLVMHIPKPSYRWSAEVAAHQEIREFIDREARIQARWQQIVEDERLHAESLQELANRIEREISEPYADSFEQLSQLKLDPAAPSTAQVESLLGYSEQRRDHAQALTNQLRARSLFGPKRAAPSGPAFIPQGKPAIQPR
ncbi:rhomboid family intramembrane serine protease [Dechloromonas sp. A34]|uniref:rhomboid family intramembrane serine protease n=1 Tax=Dechloromonas sp. A34 TaxID=447588 RepID=UPI0022489FB5|nr:rhomboid family intramembrane serine protease [Dechloromonas sp. A34]